jgi:hypothetical protein
MRSDDVIVEELLKISGELASFIDLNYDDNSLEEVLDRLNELRKDWESRK